jgi:hypothetical protein
MNIILLLEIQETEGRSEIGDKKNRDGKEVGEREN